MPAPPSPPQPGEFFTAFGHRRSVEECLPPLGERGSTQLYADGKNTKEELRRLNHSLTISFLELLDITTQCSSLHPEKVRHIQIIAQNLLQLITEQRAAQAAGRLVEMSIAQNQRYCSLSETLRKELIEAQRLAQQGQAAIKDPPVPATEADGEMVQASGVACTNNVEMTSAQLVQEELPPEATPDFQLYREQILAAVQALG